MKLNDLPAQKKSETPARHFRRLKSNELVSHGDFVGNAQQGFELWEGPGGFRADSFLQPIYRRDGKRPLTTNKPK
jgi:hypothetical protein